MRLSDYFRGPKYRKRAEELERHLLNLKGRYEQLHNLAKEFGGMTVLDIRERIEREQTSLERLTTALKKAEEEMNNLAKQAADLRSQILVVEENILLESFALYVPKFKLNASHEYKTRLDSTRERQKNLIKTGKAATGNEDWTVNGSKVQGRKLVNDMIKLVIRSFNNEADFCVDNVRFDNVELGEKRIRQSFETCNRLGTIMSVRLSDEYLTLKLDELHLAHEYQVKKQEEKEEAKRIREELREQQRLEQEIRAARDKITKERKHYAAALSDLQSRLGRTTSEEERGLLLTKIAEVEAGKLALDNEEKLIDYREQNAKAGYVYVISNIGAFGEGVYKIGMTRRLIPMERIDELGDASVPFSFDVHTLVFSENAPALEAKLHERFGSGRLNKINARKEFFRANLADVESVIRENFGAPIEFIHEPAAEQYRESLRIVGST